MTVTIYADSNIYRYVASGELELVTVGSIQFAYSTIHFEEMIRTNNREMLKGMEALKAVQVVTNENGEYDIDSVGVCLGYESPTEKFDKYSAQRVSTDDEESSLHELLLRFLGADNLEVLRSVPQSLLDLADEAVEYGDQEGDLLAIKARKTASELESFIESDLSKNRSLMESRKEIGYAKGASSIHANDTNPINAIWERIGPKMNGMSRDQFFGFEAISGIEIERSRIGNVASCHLILNMIGFHPDNGLARREKIQNILSDGQHVGYGSICGGFLTSDHRLYKKARAIYAYKQFPSQAIHAEYKSEGMSVTLVEPGAIKRVQLPRYSGA